MDEHRDFFYYTSADFLEHTQNILHYKNAPSFRLIIPETPQELEKRKVILKKGVFVSSYQKNQLCLQKTYHPQENFLVDFVLPIFHGFGEDGSMQGFFEILNVAFSGCDIAASAVTFDKLMTKRIAHSASILTAPFIEFYSWEENPPKFEALCYLWQTDRIFLKKSRTGSSVDVYCAKNQSEYEQFLNHLRRVTHRIVIEKGLSHVRELECSILGYGAHLFITEPGEVIINKEKHFFYDYEAKYLNPTGSSMVIVAQDLSQAQKVHLKTTAKKMFELCGCCDMARVDFLLDLQSDQIYFNEINTIPGFTEMSLYSKMLEAAGIDCVTIVLHWINRLVMKKYHLEDVSNTFVSSLES
jgi:D-alanine-D-alanine ligase